DHFIAAETGGRTRMVGRDEGSGGGIVSTGRFDPWAVIGGEDDQSMVVEADRAEFVEDPAGRGVELLDRVAVEAVSTLALERLARPQRDVGHVVGEVEEEGSIT